MLNTECSPFMIFKIFKMFETTYSLALCSELQLLRTAAAQQQAQACSYIYLRPYRQGLNLAKGTLAQDDDDMMHKCIYIPTNQLDLKSNEDNVSIGVRGRGGGARGQLPSQIRAKQWGKSGQSKKKKKLCVKFRANRPLCPP